MLKAFTNRSFDKAIFALAIPALGTLAADPLVSLIDTAFIGRLGAAELGALGINTAIFALSFFIFNFLAYGTTPMISNALGKNDKAQAGKLITQAFVLAIFLGLSATLILQVFARPIASLMGASDELLEPVLSYLRIRAFAGPAILLITAGNGVFRGFQNTRTPLVITLILNAVNLILDPLLIFGFGWGLAGAAIATLIAQWIGALLFVWLIFIKNKENYLSYLYWPSFTELRPFLKVGWELFLRTLSLSLTFTLATATATRLGTTAVAAHQVAMQIWILLALTIDALAIAGQSLVSNYLGQAKFKDAKAVSDRLLFMGLVGGVCFAILFFFLRTLLPQLFTNDATVIATVLTIFPFVILTQPLNALVFVWDGIFIGANDFGFLAISMILAALLAGIVLLLVIPFNWGLIGVWWGITALVTTRAFSLAWRYPKLFNKKAEA